MISSSPPKASGSKVYLNSIWFNDGILAEQGICVHRGSHTCIACVDNRNCVEGLRWLLWNKRTTEFGNFVEPEGADHRKIVPSNQVERACVRARTTQTDTRVQPTVGIAQISTRNETGIVKFKTYVPVGWARPSKVVYDPKELHCIVQWGVRSPANNPRQTHKIKGR
jgi:hypothetical protein